MLVHGREPATSCKKVSTRNQPHLTHAFIKNTLYAKYVHSTHQFLFAHRKCKIKPEGKTDKLPNSPSSFHRVNKYTRDVHTLSNPVYSFSVKEEVGKGKQKVKQWKQKYQIFHIHHPI